MIASNDEVSVKDVHLIVTMLFQRKPHIITSPSNVPACLALRAV